SSLETRTGGSNSGNFINFHWLRQSLNIDRAKRLHLHIAFGQSQSVRSCENGVGRRHLFHASSQVCSLANCPLVHLQVAPDGPHHYLPGVQTHSYLDGNSLGPPYSLGVAFHRFLHSERRIAAAHCVIFMSKRRTK